MYFESTKCTLSPGDEPTGRADEEHASLAGVEGREHRAHDGPGGDERGVDPGRRSAGVGEDAGRIHVVDILEC